MLHNAVIHNEAGTTVSVSTQLSGKKDSVEVIVSDNGKAISDEQFMQLTQPFFTDGTDQSGSGLGLSIAKDVARMHQGELFTM